MSVVITVYTSALYLWSWASLGPRGSYWSLGPLGTRLSLSTRCSNRSTLSLFGKANKKKKRKHWVCKCTWYMLIIIIIIMIFYNISKDFTYVRSRWTSISLSSLGTTVSLRSFGTSWSSSPLFPLLTLI